MKTSDNILIASIGFVLLTRASEPTMITPTKLKLYKSYRGDVDLLGLAASPKDRTILDDPDFT